jgi:hypothetical protein
MRLAFGGRRPAPLNINTPSSSSSSSSATPSAPSLA